MDWILPLLLVAAGILAASALIVAKKPDAKQLIDKLAPYQATMGVALLVWCIYNMFVHIGISWMMLILKAWPIGGIALWGGLVSGILLGILFGMPMVAKMSASGAAKGEQMAKKMAPFQVIIGLIAIVSGLMLLLITAGILKPAGM